MTTPKLTKAQRRYLLALHVADLTFVLRPSALGGKYGDLRVINRLRAQGLVDEMGKVTRAGRAALKDGAK